MKIKKKYQKDEIKKINDITENDKKNKDNKLLSCNEEKKEIKPYIPYSIIPRIDEPYPDITLIRFGQK